MGQKQGCQSQFIEALESRNLRASIALDPSFAADGIAARPFGAADTINAFSSPDGGYLAAIHDTSYIGIGKLTADGAADTTFAKRGRTLYSFPDVSAVAAAQAPDGKIVILAAQGSVQSTEPPLLIRFDSNGLLDPTFGTNGSAPVNFDQVDNDYEKWKVAVAPSGGILVLHGRDLTRVNPNGQIDESFGVNGNQYTNLDSNITRNVLAIAPDGKIVIGFAQLNDPTLLRRLTPQGQSDPTFINADGVTHFDDTITSVTVGPDGTVFVGALGPHVYRFAPGASGQAVSAIKVGGGAVVALRSAGKGKIVAMVGDYNGGGPEGFRLVRIKASGAQDLTFNDTGIVNLEETMSSLPADFFIDGAGRFNLFGGELAVARVGGRPALGLSPTGTLVVTTTDANDVVGLRRATLKRIRLVVNGVVKYLPESLIKKFDVATFGGNDVITCSVNIPCVVDAGSGKNKVATADGNDTLTAGGGNDIIYGGGGNDRITANGGADYIVDVGGGAFILAGSGNDHIDTRNVSSDVIDGGAGEDELRGDNLDTTLSIETLLP